MKLYYSPGACSLSPHSARFAQGLSLTALLKHAAPLTKVSGVS